MMLAASRPYVVAIWRAGLQHSGSTHKRTTSPRCTLHSASDRHRFLKASVDRAVLSVPVGSTSRRIVIPRQKLVVRCQSPAWTAERSPYETLVYDEKAELADGETPQARFIQIQASYELLMDPEERQRYDMEHRSNPMQASKAWVEWVMKKRKAFEQRGNMAAAAWAEQQQREVNLRARNRSRMKVDPEEERRILVKERQASIETFETTLKRHTLVLKRRDIERRKAEEASKKMLVAELLAAEGFEVDEDA